MTLNQITSIKPNTESSTLITPTDYSGIQSQIKQLQASLTSLQEKYDNLGSIVNTGTLNSGTIANSGAITTNSLTANSGDIGDIGYSSLTESTPAITKTVTGTSIPVAVCNNPYFGAHILLGTQTIDFIYNAGTMIAQSSSGLADSIIITVNDNKYYICLQSSTGASSTLLQVWAYQSTLTSTELNYSSSGGLFVSTTGNVAISGAITFDNATYSFQDLSVPGTLTAETIKATNETISASTIGDLTATTLSSSTATLTTANITTANVKNEAVTGDMSVAGTITTPTISASTISTNNMEVRGALVNGTSATLGVTSATSLDTGSISHKDKYITLAALGSNTDYYVIALPIFEGRYEIKGVDTNGIEFDAEFEMRKASAALPTIYVKYSTNYLIYFSNIQYYAGKLYIKTSLGNFKLYYYSDTEDAADAPMTYTNYYPYSTPVFSNDITYKSHELILGDGTTNYGLYANGEVAAVIVAQTGSSGSFDSIVAKDATIQNNLVVQKYLTDGAGSKGTASQTLKVDPVDGTTVWTTDKDLTIATTNTLANATTSATYNSNTAATVNTYVPDQEVNKADEVTFAKVTAPVVGNVTGNVTGNVAGDLTGNINKTKGILYNSADDTTTSLLNGTAGQTLTINEDGAAPIWKTNQNLTVATTNTLSEATASATYNPNTAAAVKSYVPDQEVNKADEVVFAKVTAPLSGNATTASDLSKSAGSVLYQSADNTTSVLANGTAGQVLSMSSAIVPEWKDPSTLVCIPPIGSYLQMPTNPNTLYSGTTWTQGAAIATEPDWASLVDVTSAMMSTWYTFTAPGTLVANVFGSYEIETLLDISLDGGTTTLWSGITVHYNDLAPNTWGGSTSIPIQAGMSVKLRHLAHGAPTIKFVPYKTALYSWTRTA